MVRSCAGAMSRSTWITRRCGPGGRWKQGSARRADAARPPFSQLRNVRAPLIRADRLVMLATRPEHNRYQSTSAVGEKKATVKIVVPRRAIGPNGGEAYETS